MLCASARFTLNRRACSNPEQDGRQVRGAFVSSVRHSWEHSRDLVHLFMFVASTVKAGNRGLQHSLTPQKEWDLPCCLSEDISV